MHASVSLYLSAWSWEIVRWQRSERSKEDDAEETVFFEDEDGVVVFAPGEADGVGDTNGWVDDDGFDIVNWFQLMIER